MKKIPTLFKRTFDGHKIVGITDEITPGCEKAFLEGDATIKFDGSCCAIIDGIFYKRYDCKKDKTPPANAIPCCDPDPVTGHWPHWIPVGLGPEDKWFREAYINTFSIHMPAYADGTYEACGPHIQGNPYDMNEHYLIPHGREEVLYLERTFEGVKEWLRDNPVEGLVFWLDGEPVCKIKRSDFGLPWNGKGERK